MATTGTKNLDKNWRGSNKSSKVKKQATYYEKVNNLFKQSGTLQKGTDIMYIDNLTTMATKVAIQISGKPDIYYTSIDNLIKPNSSAANATPLGPASFGLENKTFQSGTFYYQEIQKSLNSRADIPGELFDYLYELLDYVKNGAGDYNGIDKTFFPWGQIQNYYGEVIGPLVCIYRGILSGIVPASGLASASIFMPPDSERLYDYKIIVGKNEYLISAKTAKGVSNQVKPQFVTESVDDPSLIGTDEFNLLQILSNNTVISGAFYGWQAIQKNNKLTAEAISSILSVYRGDAHNLKLPDPGELAPFIDLYLPQYKGNIGNVTVGEVRYKCEQLIQDWSKQPPQNTVLKNIFSSYLNKSRVIYVKLDINKSTGRPTFTASSGGEAKIINNLYLRTSNYASRTADRIGFQVG
jgi:hypothetical protein